MPTLPERQDGDSWHPNAIDFWQQMVNSPMASEYDVTDLQGLLILADLTHTYWMLPASAATRKKDVAAEIRLQRNEYGLGPMSRRRLQWTAEKAEEATDAGNRRRSGAPTPSVPTDDPRLMIELEPTFS